MRPGLYPQIQGVIVDRQSRDLGPVVPLEVVPFPSGTEGRSAEVTLVSDQVANYPLNTGFHKSRGKRFQCSSIITGVQSGSKVRIPAPVYNQIAIESAIRIRNAIGIQRCFNLVVRAQVVERQRSG